MGEDDFLEAQYEDRHEPDLEDFRVYDYDEEPDAWAVCDLMGSPIAGPFGSMEEAEEAAERVFEPGRWVVSPLYL